MPTTASDTAVYDAIKARLVAGNSPPPVEPPHMLCNWPNARAWHDEEQAGPEYGWPRSIRCTFADAAVWGKVFGDDPESYVLTPSALEAMQPIVDEPRPIPEPEPGAQSCGGLDPYDGGETEEEWEAYCDSHTMEEEEEGSWIYPIESMGEDKEPEVVKIRVPHSQADKRDPSPADGYLNREYHFKYPKWSKPGKVMVGVSTERARLLGPPPGYDGSDADWYAEQYNQ